jgi:hypothetical protein
MKLVIIKSVKFIAPILMLAAIALEGNFIYLYLNHQEIPKFLIASVIISTLIIVSHGIEGVIAGFIAKGKEKNPLLYGIYTFFIGTIALYELFESE